MANIVQIKRGASAPSVNDLESYELGWNTRDKKLYIKDDNTIRLISSEDWGTTTWGEITGNLSNQTDLQTALNSKSNIHTITKTTNSNVTLQNLNTTVITSQQSNLTINLPTPTAGINFECGLIFCAGQNMNIQYNPPAGYAIYWEEEPDYSFNKIYEISFRNLWVTRNNKIVISARFGEV